jgi:hypothetical protein
MAGNTSTLNIRDRKVPSEFGSDLMRARFMAKVVVNRATRCHEWQGASNGNFGYGQLRASGISWIAHRAAWELFRGKIPEGKYVLHVCDNPRCVNVHHLFLGTQADNVHDMQSKGRYRGGSKYGHPCYSFKYPSEEERIAARRASKRKYKERQKLANSLTY